jgi:hypothetical protein
MSVLAQVVYQQVPLFVLLLVGLLLAQVLDQQVEGFPFLANH